jgi:prepilin-type N-terminal cleavage/methylation domain-containing protein
MPKQRQGFTLIELLIVVVIIAVLASISAVAYTNIRQRATNAAYTDAASKIFRALQAYIVANNAYPIIGGSVSACVTSISGCTGEGGSTVANNTTFNTNMATLSTLPQDLPSVGADRKGIYVQYASNLLLSGASQPMIMIYYLQGNNQKCGLSNVVEYSWPDPDLSTTGNSSNYSTMTRCWISIPGPAHS